MCTEKRNIKGYKSYYELRDWRKETSILLSIHTSVLLDFYNKHYFYKEKKMISKTFFYQKLNDVFCLIESSITVVFVASTSNLGK